MTHVITILCAALIGILSFPQTPSAGPPKEITVSAAMSLKNAFEEIGKLYESKRGVKVIFNFGASGDLLKQIGVGAPVDVFAPAAKKEMDEADNKGYLLSGSRVDFAVNTIMLVTPAVAKAPIESFEDLKTDRIRKIAMGNPKTVPAGRYAEEVFAYFRILDAVKNKLVPAESVRQVLDYVARGEVDAGIVYSTDAVTRPKEVRIVAPAPVQSHTPVVYPVAVVKGTKNEAAAQAFLALLRSPEGQRILEKYGFKNP